MKKQKKNYDAPRQTRHSVRKFNNQEPCEEQPPLDEEIGEQDQDAFVEDETQMLYEQRLSENQMRPSYLDTHIELENIIELTNESGSEADEYWNHRERSWHKQNFNRDFEEEENDAQSDFFQPRYRGKRSKDDSYHNRGYSDQLQYNKDESQPKYTNRRKYRKKGHKKMDEKSGGQSSIGCFSLIMLATLGYLGFQNRSNFVDYLQSADTALLKNTTIYQFEVARHGARAPIDESFSKDFINGASMLTPMGMRQKYLLGLYNTMNMTRHQNNQQEAVHIQSTNTYRTIQSAYAEMAGFTTNLMDDSVKIINEKRSKARIPFKTRNAANYESVYPKGFIPIPVYAQKDPEQDDSGLDEAACPSVKDSNLALIDLDSSYQQHLDIVPRLISPLSKYFDLPNPITFNQCSNFCDMLVARIFEGTLSWKGFTAQQKSDILTIGQWSQRGKFSQEAKVLYSSRLLAKMFERMDQKIEEISKIEDPQQKLPQPEFDIFSAHETQIQLLWEFLEPEQFELPDYTPFSSFITFEMMADQSCLKQMVEYKKGYNDENISEKHCFHLKIKSNGVDLKFKACQDDRQQQQTNAMNGQQQEKVFSNVCPYHKFKTYLKGKTYKNHGFNLIQLNGDCKQ